MRGENWNQITVDNFIPISGLDNSDKSAGLKCVCVRLLSAPFLSILWWSAPTVWMKQHSPLLHKLLQNPPPPLLQILGPIYTWLQLLSQVGYFSKIISPEERASTFNKADQIKSHSFLPQIKVHVKINHKLTKWVINCLFFCWVTFIHYFQLFYKTMFQNNSISFPI